MKLDGTLSGMCYGQLRQITEQGFAVPRGLQPGQFIPELLELLGHPDPKVRDEQAYSILATWLERGWLDDRLAELGDKCAASLSHPEVLRRSFSALILCECLERGRLTGLVERRTAQLWMQEWAQWYPHEKDVRSFGDSVGWIHTVAHGADVAGAWARWSLLASELQELGQVIEARLRSLPEHLNQMEDDRLALALLSIFSQPVFGPEQLHSWSLRYRTLWDSPSFRPTPPGAVLAVRTLHSLHTFLHLGATASGEKVQAAHHAAATCTVQDLLRGAAPYCGQGS